MRSGKNISELRQLCAAKDAPWQDLWNKVTLNLRSSSKESKLETSEVLAGQVQKRPKREVRKKLQREAKVVLLRDMKEESLQK